MNYFIIVSRFAKAYKCINVIDEKKNYVKIAIFIRIKTHNLRSRRNEGEMEMCTYKKWDEKEW